MGGPSDGQTKEARVAGVPPAGRTVGPTFKHMTERQVVIGHRLGLHARAAAKIVQLSNRYQSNISIFRNDRGGDIEADARSILSILFLAAGHGSTVAVRASGVDEHEAVDCICEYLKG